VICPNCAVGTSKTDATRRHGELTYRQRSCKRCEHVFQTIERELCPKCGEKGGVICTTSALKREKKRYCKKCKKYYKTHEALDFNDAWVAYREDGLCG